jgi:hypothetical protein
VCYSTRSSPSKNCLERVQQQGQKADPGKNKEARGKKRGRQGCGRSFFHVAREAKDNFWQSTFRQAVGRQHPAFACLSLTSSSRRTRRAAEMSLPKASRPGEFPFSFVREPSGSPLLEWSTHRHSSPLHVVQTTVSNGKFCTPKIKIRCRGGEPRRYNLTMPPSSRKQGKK